MINCILNIDPPLVGSFIYPHLLKIQDYLVNIAPENKARMFDICARGLEFQILDLDRNIARSCSVKRRIELSISLIERLWGFCFASYMLCSKYIMGKYYGNRESIMIDFDLTDPLTIDTVTIVKTIEKDKLTIEDSQILSMIYNKYSSDDGYDVALVLFAMSLSYITLHEIGHIELGHIKDENKEHTMESEKQADEFAHEWVLSFLQGQDASDKIFRSRVLGVANANLFLVFSKLRKYKVGSDTFEDEEHPPAYDRLSWAVGSYINSELENDQIWSYVVAIIALYAYKYAKVTLSEGFDTFYDAAQAYFNIFSDHSL
ncbi:MAG: phage exclusion protein Lit family protein [Candidatus Cloacimonetes bacterium]|nr:phage exclusion protein Lit family protein [Candidatus Cloacimonadota bacterium]